MRLDAIDAGGPLWCTLGNCKAARKAMEAEADMWSLNWANELPGLPEAMLKLAEDRKTEPRPIEEFIFFDHPGARGRILMAMRWREQQLP